MKKIGNDADGSITKINDWKEGLKYLDLLSFDLHWKLLVKKKIGA